jgi:hypothetical protein
MLAITTVNQQRQLLHERTTEGATVLGNVFGGVQSTLTTLAASSPPSPGATDRFSAAAKPLLGLATTIGALSTTNGAVSVVAGVGTAPTTGALVGADRAALAARAATTKGVVSGVVDTPVGRRLSFALAASNGLVLYEDLVFDPAKPYDTGRKPGPVLRTGRCRRSRRRDRRADRVAGRRTPHRRAGRPKRAVTAALRQLNKLPDGAYLAVNVSPSTAATPKLADALAGLDARRIVLSRSPSTP